MARSTTPAPSDEPVVEEIFDSTPESAPTEGGVDVEALLGDMEPLDPNALLAGPSSDLLPHEADRDFAPDLTTNFDDSPFAAYLGRDTETTEEGDTPAPVAPVETPEEAKPEADLADPGLVEIAKGLGLSPQDLLGIETPAPEATPTPEAAPVQEIPAAVQAQLQALEARIAELTAKQEQEVQTQALAEQEAQVAAERTAYEAAQRAAYEEQFVHLEDEDRAALVDAKVEADLLRWDAQVSTRLAEVRTQAQRQQEMAQAREAEYTAESTKLIEANPTLALEIAPGYRMADFLADTHRAASDAYGMEAIGDFGPYAKAFEGGLKAVQTKAFQAGIAYAQARSAKTAASPAPLSNKGGGSAPAAPKAGPAKIDLNNINFFAHEGRATRR